MPIYTRWEKFKPVPNHVTLEPTLEERIPALIALWNEITEMKAIETAGGTVMKRRFNVQGAKTVLVRFAKYLKESLD